MIKEPEFDAEEQDEPEQEAPEPDEDDEKAIQKAENDYERRVDEYFAGPPGKKAPKPVPLPRTVGDWILYRRAVDEAMGILDGAHDSLSLTDALKQAGSDNGIAWGDDMGRFVAWGTDQILRGAR